MTYQGNYVQAELGQDATQPSLSPLPPYNVVRLTPLVTLEMYVLDWPWGTAYFERCQLS